MRLRADVLAAGLLLASCAAAPERKTVSAGQRTIERAPVSDLIAKVGKPYSVGGVTYTPADDRALDEVGVASWYGEELRGRPTANGERFDPDAITAAHRTLPLPSYVEVTALATGRTIVARVNDRGPFHRDRILDLSIGAARQLKLTGNGAQSVRVRRVFPSDSERLVLRRGQALPSRTINSERMLADIGERSSSARQPPIAKPWVPNGGPLYLQVAAFSSAERAATMAASLSAQVIAIAGTWRVRIGPFANLSEAQAALEPLAARGYPDARITR